MKQQERTGQPSAGWLLAAEHVATAMATDSRASHRVLLLSDGQANQGIMDGAELARHTRGLLERGILTSAVGIGDGYDELLLGRMAGWLWVLQKRRSRPMGRPRVTS